MLGKIQILPETVANQIAAGEVVQRPASVVKELLENSIDAGSNHIELNVKDSGKTLIQVIDNGEGMSRADARLCFERHATSKITNSEDLFHIHTKGFRGEAMASIASVAQVELYTKTEEENTGTYIEIHGGKLIKEEPVAWNKGTCVNVKNLFFNVPARRKFLGSDSYEWKMIMQEVIRIALAHPDIRFTVTHNKQPVADYMPGQLKQRIIAIFGEKINEKLVPVNTQTDIISITGFIGKPEYSKKHRTEQFFFANQRYIRYPFLHHAVMDAYEDLLPSGENPAYFIFLNCDPSKIDVNIHPTKTEVKFEDEKAIYQILKTTVRQSLGKFQIAPSLDFDRERIFDDLELSPQKIKVPRISFNPDYNPFKTPTVHSNEKSNGSQFPKRADTKQQPSFDQIRSFYDVPDPAASPSDKLIELPSEQNTDDFLVYRHQYILFILNGNLIAIDRFKAHVRVIYEKIIQSLASNEVSTQKLLLPDTFELSDIELIHLQDANEWLQRIGFEIESFGPRTFAIHGVPSFMTHSNYASIIKDVLKEFNIKDQKELKIGHQIALLLAQKTAVRNGTPLKKEENQMILQQWLACEEPLIYPGGGSTVAEIQIKN